MKSLSPIVLSVSIVSRCFENASGSCCSNRFHARAAMKGSDAASVTGKYGEYLTPAEARGVLFGYIKAEGLEHPTVRVLACLRVRAGGRGREKQGEEHAVAMGDA